MRPASAVCQTGKRRGLPALPLPSLPGGGVGHLRLCRARCSGPGCGNPVLGYTSHHLYLAACSKCEMGVPDSSLMGRWGVYSSILIVPRCKKQQGSLRIRCACRQQL